MVTGASSGIGAAFAERLAADGHDLVLVARRRDRLEAVAEKLRAEHGAGAEVVEADLADPDALAAVEARAAEGLRFLVNNAGYGGYGPFLDLEPDDAEALIRVHVLATTRLARAALPAMIESNEGTIVNLASGLVFSTSLPPDPLPHRATYVGAKSYVVAFTKALALELEGSGVRVQVVVPGIVDTEFHDLVGADRSRFPDLMPPADVATASIAGLELGEVVCVPSLPDPNVLDERDQLDRSVFGTMRSGALAPRYLRE
jgi:short-subunit dehydrogenase